MLYLNDHHIREAGIDWPVLTGVIKEVLRTEEDGDTARPLKPYLRFQNPRNRIIAMPAYVGGDVKLAGIKWIASFPDNPTHGLPRAHNTVILNDTDTGQPVAIVHSGLLSGLRTAAVSGMMLQAYMEMQGWPDVALGIIGWGPIGQLHLRMCAALLGMKLKRVFLYDLKGVDVSAVPAELRPLTVVAQDWREVYRNSDVFATCTVSNERYINERPRPGMLLLGVSLRDYAPDSVAHIATVVVDDWEEVCRENTDIELLHTRLGLQKRDVITLADVVLQRKLLQTDRREPVFFNPMGLAVFDIGIAGYYWKRATALGIGTRLLV